MEAIQVVTGRAVPLDRSDVDTDQIIPSDWLKRVERTGFGAGLFGALFPLIVADLTWGTGRFNLTRGAVQAAQGVGAALSTTVAGLIVTFVGYSAAFLALAAIAALGLMRREPA